MVCGLVIYVFVGDEFEEWHGGDFDLLISQFVEFGDAELAGVLDALEIGIVGRPIPFEEASVVDEVLHQEIFLTLHEIRGLLDFVQGGNRRAEDVEYGKGNLARLRSIEKSDVAQRGQCRRHQTGADVDYGDGGACRIQRVEDLHLIRSLSHVDDFGNVRMKAFQRTARRFGVKGASGYVVPVKIIKQGARNGGLADPALICAYHNHYWLCHNRALKAPNQRSDRNIRVPALGDKMAKTRGIRALNSRCTH